MCASSHPWVLRQPLCSSTSFTTLGLTTRRDDDSTAATDNDFDAHIPWVTEMFLVYVVGAGADFDYGYDYGYGYYLCRW